MIVTNFKIIIASLLVFGISLVMSQGNLYVAGLCGFIVYLLSFEGNLLHKKKQRKKYDFLRIESDFSNALIQIIAAVIKEDKSQTDSELRYVEKALLINFDRTRVETWLKHIKFNISKEELHIVGLCHLIRNNFKTSSKVQLMHLLVGIAAADGLMTKQEEKLLKSIAVEIRLPYVTFKQILTMFRFRYEGQQQQKKRKTYSSLHRLQAAYSVMGLTSEATEREIKKAYRKLAVIHHPDKVAHLGEDVQEAANDQFQIISEAYELIKDKKGFS